MAPLIPPSTEQSTSSLAPLQAQSPEQPAKVSLPILAEEAAEKVNSKAVEVALEVLNAHLDTYTRKLFDKCITEMQAVIERDNRKLGAEKDQSGCIQYRRLTQMEFITLCCSILQAEPVMGSLDRYSCKFQFDNYQPIITIKDNDHHNGVELYFGHQQDEGELAAGEVQGASLLELQELIKSSPDLNITISPANFWGYRNNYPTADAGANSLQVALYMILLDGNGWQWMAMDGNGWQWMAMDGNGGNTFMPSQQRNDVFDFAITGTQQYQMKKLSVGFLYILSEAIKKAKLDNTTGGLYTTIKIGSDVYTIKERIIDKPAASGRTTEDPLEASGANSEFDIDNTPRHFERLIKKRELLSYSNSDSDEDSIVGNWSEYSDDVHPSVIDICDSDGTIILTMPQITLGQLKTVLENTHFPPADINLDAIEEAAALNAEVKQPNWQLDRLHQDTTYRGYTKYCIDFLQKKFNILEANLEMHAKSIRNSLTPGYPVDNNVIKASLDSCQQVNPSIKILAVSNINTIKGYKDNSTKANKANKAKEDSYSAYFNMCLGLGDLSQSKGRNNKMVLPIENNKIVLPIMCEDNRLCLLFIQHNQKEGSLTIHTLQPFTPGDPDIDDFLEVITKNKNNKEITRVSVFLMDNTGLDRLEQNDSAVHALLMLGFYVKMADPLPDAAYEQYKSCFQQFKPNAVGINRMTMVRCHLHREVGAYLDAMEGSTESAQ